MYKCNIQVCVTIVAMQKQEVLHILSVCTACKVHTPLLCCHLRPLWLYHIFPHYLTNDMVFEKTLLNIKCVCFDFLYNFYINIPHSEKNLATCYKYT